MKVLTKLVLASSLAIVSSYGMADPHCDGMVPFGYPTIPMDVTDTTNLCRIAYVVQHDNTRKVPLYSAELLLIENIPNKEKRSNDFKADPDLPPGKRAELSDYESDNTDRGHMTPFEDARKNSAAARQTNYLSNTIPQNLHLNRGMWRKLENQTRRWAKEAPAGLHVMTGPVFQGKPEYVGNKVAKPSSVFKVIIDKKTMQGVAYLIPNQGPKKGAKLEHYKTTIAEVEKVTRMNFTPKLIVVSTLKTEIGQQFK